MEGRKRRGADGSGKVRVLRGRALWYGGEGTGALYLPLRFWI